MTYQNLIRFLAANPTGTAYETMSDDWQSPDHYNPTPEEIQQRIAEIHNGTAPCCNSHQQGRLRRQARELVQYVEITHVGMGARRNGKIQMGDDE